MEAGLWLGAPRKNLLSNRTILPKLGWRSQEELSSVPGEAPAEWVPFSVTAGPALCDSAVFR